MTSTFGTLEECRLGAAEGRCERAGRGRRRHAAGRAWNLPALVGGIMGVMGVMAFSGCGPKGGPAGAIDTRASSVGRIARLVEHYRIAHRGQFPRSEQEIRGFAATVRPEDLKHLGIGDLNACFTSDRDGQPLVLRLGSRDDIKGDPTVICFEREGRDGLRLVGKLGSDVEIADQARFTELVPDP